MRRQLDGRRRRVRGYRRGARCDTCQAAGEKTRRSELACLPMELMCCRGLGLQWGAQRC